MKLITRDTDYALRAVCYIAKQKDKIVPVSRMIKELKMPGPFLRKILQVLNKEGILKSHRGQGGGFSLKVAPVKIYLVKLAEIFQGPLKLNECIFRAKVCPSVKVCALSAKLGRIEKIVKKELSLITIASLGKRE
ncbi:MAG: Rrf2 family transcriptional regulator [Candidatus Omnitrophota bacterium]|jgi:Rrf2 family protein